MTERTIRMAAKELAAADWDSGAHSQRFRKFWPRQKDFVNRNWPTYVPMVRTILSTQLGDKGTPETMKEAIYKALIEDREKSFIGTPARVGYSPNFTLRPDQPGVRERKIFHDE